MFGFGRNRSISHSTGEAYRTCAVARGAVRFAFPDGWIVRGTGASVVVTNAPPPDDTEAIEVSVLELPPDLGADLTLEQMVRQASARHSAGSPPETHSVRRDGVEIVWTEKISRDGERAVVVRQAWCRGSGVHAVVCYGFPEGASTGQEQRWAHLLDSLVLGGPAPE